MHELKKHLETNGFVTFNLKDYPEYSEYYEYYKKFICNENNNLKEYITGIKANLTKKTGEDFQIQQQFNSFEEAKNFFETEMKPNCYLDEHVNSSQFWYYGNNNEIQHSIQKCFYKIVFDLYGARAEELSHHVSVTYYEPGCFLKKHQDGKCLNRICAILLYLNDEDYNPEWGGNIVFNDNHSVIPTYGNVAVLDFKTHNVYHEVKKITEGYGRYAILSFINLEGFEHEMPSMNYI